MAGNYWGIPRTTHDLDFVIILAPGDIPRLVEAFAGDFYIDAEMVRSAYQPPHQFNAIDERSGMKVDFWMGGLTPFDRSAFQRRQAVPVVGESGWISSPEDTILFKLRWYLESGSEQQLRDVANLLAVQGERLDFAYIAGWAVELGVREVWDRIQAGEVRVKSS